MPVSKKRKKKNGKTAKRGEDRLTALTLQDLINVVAYQDYKAAGVYDEKPDFNDPDHQAVIHAVHETKIEQENEDGR